MSRSRSVSLEIVPPKPSREIVPPPRDLAAVMDAVFKSNSKQNMDDGKGLEDVVPPPRDLAAVMDAVFKSNSKQNRDDGKVEDAETSNTVNITSFIFALA
jgi:hypothetical protein